MVFWLFTASPDDTTKGYKHLNVEKMKNEKQLINSLFYCLTIKIEIVFYLINFCCLQSEILNKIICVLKIIRDRKPFKGIDFDEPRLHEKYRKRLM